MEQKTVQAHRGQNGGADVDGEGLVMIADAWGDFGRPGVGAGRLVRELQWHPLRQIAFGMRTNIRSKKNDHGYVKATVKMATDARVHREDERQQKPRKAWVQVESRAGRTMSTASLCVPSHTCRLKASA